MAQSGLPLVMLSIRQSSQTYTHPLSFRQGPINQVKSPDFEVRMLIMQHLKLIHFVITIKRKDTVWSADPVLISFFFWNQLLWAKPKKWFYYLHAFVKTIFGVRLFRARRVARAKHNNNVILHAIFCVLKHGNKSNFLVKHTKAGR